MGFVKLPQGDDDPFCLISVKWKLMRIAIPISNTKYARGNEENALAIQRAYTLDKYVKSVA